MIQQIKDYAKCVVANKVALGGYIGFALFPVVKWVERKVGINLPTTDFVFLPSVFALGITFGGLDTYATYRRVKAHIKEHGVLVPRYRKKFPSAYCVQAGLRVAVKEAGLEKLI